MIRETEKSLSLSGQKESALSRRGFLKLGALVALGLTSSACGLSQVDAQDLPEPVPATEETMPPTLSTGSTGSPQAGSGQAETATATETQTPTESPTPTEAPKIDEHDLEPNFIQETSVEFMGVQINAQLITDKSLDPVITKVTVPDAVYAEFIARTIFKTWWKKGNEKHTGLANEDEFRAFMALWATAQETNDPADWAKVQINNIWANDLNDGNGYVQEPFTIWPMFEGVAPEGVRGINNLVVTLVKASRVENITPGIGSNPGGGYGANLEGDSLYLYRSPADGLYSANNITAVITSVDIIILKYNGAPGINFDSIPYDSRLYDLLRGKISVD